MSQNLQGSLNFMPGSSNRFMNPTQMINQHQIAGTFYGAQQPPLIHSTPPPGSLVVYPRYSTIYPVPQTAYFAQPLAGTTAATCTPTVPSLQPVQPSVIINPIPNFHSAVPPPGKLHKFSTVSTKTETKPVTERKRKAIPIIDPVTREEIKNGENEAVKQDALKDNTLKNAFKQDKSLQISPDLLKESTDDSEIGEFIFDDNEMATSNHTEPSSTKPEPQMSIINRLAESIKKIPMSLQSDSAKPATTIKSITYLEGSEKNPRGGKHGYQQNEEHHYFTRSHNYHSQTNVSKKSDKQINVTSHNQFANQQSTHHTVNNDFSTSNQKMESEKSNHYKILARDEVTPLNIHAEELESFTDEQSMNESSDQEFSFIASDEVDEQMKQQNQLKWRYSKTQLNKLKKSRLVLKDAPHLRNKLLNQKLKPMIYQSLFDKNYRFNDDEESNESFNNSFNKNQYSRKNTSGNRHCDSFQNVQNSSRSRQNDDRMIKVNLSLKNEVKLNTAENAWKPSHVNVKTDLTREERDTEDLLRNFRSLLNKITAQNFDYLVKEVSDSRRFHIDKMNKLDKVVELLFEKSISEPGFASTYAKLCQSIAEILKIDDFDHAKSKKPLKVVLISRCEREFQRIEMDMYTFENLRERLNEAKISNDEEELEKLDEIYYKIRQRANGTVKFIGELYKIDMITTKIMNQCVFRLLNNNVTEESIERVCKLLTTVGKKLEGNLPEGGLNGFFKKLNSIASGNDDVTVSSRVRFDILNLVDLRKSNWTPRANAREANPKTMKQLVEEDKKEKLNQQILLQDFNEKGKNQNSANRVSKVQDKEGFITLQTKGGIDIGKMIPQKTQNDLLGQSTLFKNFQNMSVQKQQSKKPMMRTSTVNVFSNLPTDTDGSEELTLLQHSKSASSSGKNGNRKDNKGTGNSKGNSPKTRSPSPEISAIEEQYDEPFFIDLNDKEEKHKNTFAKGFALFCKGEITEEMFMSEIKQVEFNGNILGSLFNDCFDKKKVDRDELCYILIKISKDGMIDKSMLLESLNLAIKIAPESIYDVPNVYEYIGEYFVKFLNDNVITIKDVKDLCKEGESQSKTLKYVEEYERSKSDVEPTVSTAEEKPKKSFQKLLNEVEYNLLKKGKKRNPQIIYDMIEADKFHDEPEFIFELTTLVLKLYFTKLKKQQKSKSEHQLGQAIELLQRYIDNDSECALQCINATIEYMAKNVQDKNPINEIFQLFYDRDVISEDYFQKWRTQAQQSNQNDQVFQVTEEFFSSLTDVSNDFNCTSSTVKEFN